MPILRFAALLSLLALLTLTPSTLAADKAEAPYVNSKIAKERFKDVTAEDMELLRSKKILFASRSFGLNLCNGIRILANKDKKYDLLGSYKRYDVLNAPNNIGVIPADAFKQQNFVHFLATYWPHTKRVEEMDNLLRKAPHEFGKQVDVVIIFFHTAMPENFEQYAIKMDAMQKDFPNARFIYVTAGFMGEPKTKENEAAHAWSEKVRARYKGKAPLYDLGAILSDDFSDGRHSYVPDYSKDPANVHPNTEEGQTMMAKGFLLLLRDTMKWKPNPDTKLEPIADSSGAKTETIAAAHPDYKAVRAILDANGMTKKDVNAISVVEKGRIVKLYLQESGVKELPDAIGDLTELRLLHVYGDRSLQHPLLEKVSPALGKCTKLEELLLNQNNLTTLPKEIAALTKLKTLSIADNHLKDLPAEVAAWAKKFDPKGLEKQRP